MSSTLKLICKIVGAIVIVAGLAAAAYFIINKFVITDDDEDWDEFDCFECECDDCEGCELNEADDAEEAADEAEDADAE